MTRSLITCLLAFALTAAVVGCCPDSACGDCLEPAQAETAYGLKPSIGGGIASLNGFVENKGQWPDEVLFFARRSGVEATVLRDALVFRPMPASQDDPAPAPLILHLPGDAAGRVIEGLDPLATKHHFLLGERQASDAAGFERVALRDVLPGIDIVLRADGGAFEYDLALEPGAFLDELVVEIEGAGSIESRGADALVLHTDVGEVEQHIRASWQGAAREPEACRFRVLDPKEGRQRFGFEAPEWDRDLALVLDPSLVYLTYVGGAGQELLVEAEVGPSGAMYLLARSSSATPVTPGALQGAPQGTDAWIGKLSPDGSTLEWATFLGAAQTDDPKDFALDEDGSVVVVGSTWSPGFPVTPGSFQPQIGGGGTTKSDVFVARLDPTGSSLEWATFYGAENHDAAWACALYPGGDVLVAFEPWIAGLSSTPGVVDTVFDPGDLALFRLTSDGKQRVFQTYFRASTIDDLLIDGKGNAYFAGYMSYLNTPPPLMTTPGAFKETATLGDSDGFVTKMNSDATQLVWSTYLGGEPNSGSGLDRVYALALDAAQAVYVAGYTESDTFPLTSGAFQSQTDGADGFAAKLLPNGTDLVWATYICATGFPGSTSIKDIKVDTAGNALVFGHANEPVFPVTADAFQPVFLGPLPSSGDTLLCKLDVVGESLLYATWLGGEGTDVAGELGLSAEGDVCAAFRAGPSLPTTDAAYQATYAGSSDLAIARFDFDLMPWTILGGGLAGGDVAALAGIGPLITGSSTRLALRGAPALCPAWLVAGVLELGFPFLGGTLVPFPSVVIPLGTGPLGELDFTFPWPAAPSGTSVFFQVWTPDPLAPQGWSASHGLKASIP